MDELEIDVRFEPDHEALTVNGRRSMLTWGKHPMKGNGWTLWFFPSADEDGLDGYFIPGDLVDVDQAFDVARQHLRLYYPDP
jgi:hypothetical protein